MSVRTQAPVISPRRPGRVRSRFGFDSRWWVNAARASLVGPSYWVMTRRPLPCLAFVLPMLVLYELGVAWVGGPEADAVRTGADAWMRHTLTRAGLTDRW